MAKSSYNDARSAFYKNNTDGINRHWLSNERQFLLSYLGLTSSTLSNADLIKDLFDSLGYEGSTADQWFAFLGDQGYVGALRERQRDFWISGGFSLLSQFSGASAAYSLRQVATSATDVVRVRRESDNLEQDFNANEVKGSGLLDFVVPTDVQALYNNRMYFDGVDDYVDLNESIFNTDGSDFEVEIDIMIPSGFTSTAFAGYFLSQWSGGDNTSIGIGGTGVGANANKLAFVGGSSNVLYGPVINDDLPHTIKVTLISGEYTVYVDNVSIGSVTKTNNPPAISTEVGNSTNTTNRFVEGVFYNIRKDGVVLYNGDGNLDENWTGQNGATDGTVNGSPALFTGQGFNAYASIWYDQNVPTSKDVMNFDGVDNNVVLTGSSVIGANPISLDDSFEITLDIHPSEIKSAYILNTHQGTDSYLGQHITIHMDPEGSGVSFRAAIDDDANISIANGLEHPINQSYRLKVVRDKGNTLKIYVNEVEEASVSDITTGSVLSNFDWTIGARASNLTEETFVGSISNVKFYNETSVLINSYNGDGNLNGNWEDQIGSSNGTVNGTPQRLSTIDYTTISKDATQDTTANQPQIVADGALVSKNGKPAIDFVGANENFLMVGDYLLELSANDGQMLVVKTGHSTGSSFGDGYVVAEGDSYPTYSSNYILGGLTPVQNQGVWINATLFGESGNINVQSITGFEKTGGAGTGSKPIQAYNNGATSGASGNATINTEVLNQTGIGTRGDFEGAFFDGTIQELIAYKNTDNDMIEIMANINKYWGVY